MRISIIGNGNMAKGLAIRMLAGGHSVDLHVRDKTKGEALRDEVKDVVTQSEAEITVVKIGGEVGDVLIPTVHYGGEMEDVAKEYAERAAGRIVLDISNPVDFNTWQLLPEPGKSGAEEVARMFPESQVVKAFNTTLAGTLVDGKAGGLPLDVFIAGDDEAAKDTIKQLVTDGAMRPLDVGPLANARHLEGFGLFHMTLQDQVQGNWMSGLKIVA
jgi:predicted dinucleotide-binding enzyme